jgi:hypothetical protein
LTETTLPCATPLTGHQLLEKVFCEAGGQSVEGALSVGYGGKRADIVFPDQNIIIEIKELSGDRAMSSKIQERLNRLITEDGPALGGPIIFGEATINLSQLPDVLMRRSFRLLAKRVQREVSFANRQIRETKAALTMPDAHGMLVFVTPPTKIDLHLIGWAVQDAMLGGAHSQINSLMLVEALWDSTQWVVSCISFHSIAGRDIPEGLKNEISSALTRLLNQSSIECSEEEFFARYSRKR